MVRSKHGDDGSFLAPNDVTFTSLSRTVEDRSAGSPGKGRFWALWLTPQLLGTSQKNLLARKDFRIEWTAGVESPDLPSVTDEFYSARANFIIISLVAPPKAEPT